MEEGWPLLESIIHLLINQQIINMKLAPMLFMAITFLGLSSCQEEETPTLVPVQSVTFENLYAPQEGGQGQPVSGPFTKFNFETGNTTTSETEWDIAFRGTTIIVNGGQSLGNADEPERTGNAGAYLATGTLSDITAVDVALISGDGPEDTAIPSGSGNSWYTYNPTTHLITPTPGKILVFQTHDGRFAKMEILSYYQDAPAQPDPFMTPSKYYTFNYVYQPNEGITTF